MSVGSPFGPQLTGTPFHRQFGPFPGSGAGVEIEAQVVGDEQIETAIAVVVDKRAAGTPSHVRPTQSGGRGHILKRLAAVVAIQNVAAVIRDEQIEPAVAVVRRRRRRLKPTPCAADQLDR